MDFSHTNPNSVKPYFLLTGSVTSLIVLVVVKIQIEVEKALWRRVKANAALYDTTVTKVVNQLLTGWVMGEDGLIGNIKDTLPTAQDVRGILNK